MGPAALSGETASGGRRTAGLLLGVRGLPDEVGENPGNLPRPPEVCGGSYF